MLGSQSLASKFLLHFRASQVGESWYTDKTCSRLCTCSIYNNISCLKTSCKPKQMCLPLDGLMRCRDGRKPLNMEKDP